MDKICKSRRSLPKGQLVFLPMAGLSLVFSRQRLDGKITKLHRSAAPKNSSATSRTKHLESSRATDLSKVFWSVGAERRVAVTGTAIQNSPGDYLQSAAPRRSSIRLRLASFSQGLYETHR